MRAILTIILPFFLIIQSTVGQPELETIPLRFDFAVEKLRNFYWQYPNIVADLVNLPITTIRSELFLTNKLNFKNSSSRCDQDVQLLINAAIERQIWALKVLDAWGKPLPSGILNGNLFWLGNYDECVNPFYLVNNKSFVRQPFDTQYCTIQSKPESLTASAGSDLILGLCLPSSCDRRSIATLISERLRIQNLTADSFRCSNDRINEPKAVSAGFIVFSIILSFIVLIVLTGTIVDISINIYTSMNTDASSKQNSYNETSIEDSPKRRLFNVVNDEPQYPIKRTSFVQFLIELSAIRTLKHLFTINKKENENSFKCLNGLRVLSLFWVILGHTFFFGTFYMSNVLDLLADSHSFVFQLITSGVFSVDTFFLLSGFLTAVLFVRQVRKTELSLRLMILYYVHRYIRLTPTFALIVFVSIYYTPYFGHGPIYPIQQGFESDGCRNGSWWRSFLYIGNLFKSENMCLGVTWYLFNDMQFHWIAPLALIPFVRGRKVIGYLMAIVFLLVSIGSIIGLLLYYPSLVTHALDVSANATGPNFFDKVYMSPWCRISPYAIGLVTGFLVVDADRNYRLNHFVRLVGTFCAVVLALTCIFSIYGDYVTTPGLSRASLIAYQSLSRPAWSLSVAWLIYLCSVNQGGIVNKILSFSIWLPLARLNYSAYLIHSTVIFVTLYNQSNPVYYQSLTIVNNFASGLVFSYAAAIVVTIFFESPFFIIEKRIFKR